MLQTKFTVRKPSNHNVGSGPIEKINRNIVEATNVLMPDSLGNVITMTADESITVQIRADKCELNSGVEEEIINAQRFQQNKLAID